MTRWRLATIWREQRQDRRQPKQLCFAIVVDDEEGEAYYEEMPDAIWLELDDLPIYPFEVTLLAKHPGEELLLRHEGRLIQA